MPVLTKLPLILLSAFWFLSALAAPLIVIESDVDSLEPGDVIDGATVLYIPVNSKLILVTPQGGVIKLLGPYEGQPDSSQTTDESLFERLRKILRPEGGTSLGLAVFRSVPGKVSAPWAANVTRSGNYCVRTDQHASLRRTKSAQKTTLTIERISTGEKVSRAWAAGEATLPWPTEIPLKDGEGYYAQLGHAIGATELTLHLIPTRLKTDPHRAAWMAENGCMGQARQVLQSMGHDAT